jgi:hypothetical protein
MKINHITCAYGLSRTILTRRTLVSRALLGIMKRLPSVIQCLVPIIWCILDKVCIFIIRQDIRSIHIRSTIGNSGEICECVVIWCQLLPWIRCLRDRGHCHNFGPLAEAVTDSSKLRNSEENQSNDGAFLFAEGIPSHRAVRAATLDK